MGFGGPDYGPCTRCARGTYKDVAGPGSCSECSAGKYSAIEAATSAGDCFDCPSGSSAPVGSISNWNCTCTAGFTGPDGLPCSGCVAGKYKNVTGPSDCTACPRGKYSGTINASSDVCISCPFCARSSPAGSAAESDCVCEPGCQPRTASVDCAGGCPCPASSLSANGTISDGPSFYENDAQCEWIIAASTAVSVSFSSFDTERYFDFLTINRCERAFSAAKPDLLQWRVLGLSIDPWLVDWLSGNVTDGTAREMMRIKAECRQDTARSACLPGEGYNVGLRSRLSDQSWSGWFHFNYTGPMPVDWHITWTATAGFSIAWDGAVHETFTPPSGMLFSGIRIDASDTDNVLVEPAPACLNAQQIGKLDGDALSASERFTSSTGYMQVVLATDSSITRSGFVGEFSVSGSDFCVNCPEGKFKSSTGSAFCASCSAGTYALRGAAACLVCPRGNYSGQSGSSSCARCPQGTFSNHTGASACTQCPFNQTSPAGSVSADACGCLTGFENASGTCLDLDECLPTYRTNWTVVYNATSCTAANCSCSETGIASTLSPFKNVSCGCSCNATVTAHYDKCVGVNMHCFNTEGSFECRCNHGYEADPRYDFQPLPNCTSCAPGSFKDYGGTEACTLCEAGKYSDLTGATNSSTCTSCVPGKYSILAGAESATSCLPCPLGHFSNYSAATNCSRCPRGTYSNTTPATVCSLCLMNQTSPVGSTSISACGCLEGFFVSTLSNIFGACLDINECLNESIRLGECGSENMHCHNTPGSYSCMCDPGYEAIILDSESAQLTPTTCVNIDECHMPEHQRCHKLAYCVDTEGSFECHCPIGIRGNGTLCIDDNAFCENDFSHNCHTEATCDYDIINAPGSFICTCNLGFQGSGVQCDDVNECETGIIGGGGLGFHGSCSLDAQCNNTHGSFFCTCKPGYEGNGTHCDGCLPGTYKSGVANDVCVLCASNTYSDTEASSACRVCPPDSASHPASVNASDCVCNPAFTGKTRVS